MQIVSFVRTELWTLYKSLMVAIEKAYCVEFKSSHCVRYYIAEIITVIYASELCWSLVTACQML